MIGESHLRQSLPCQDAYKLVTASHAAESWAGFSVADGHGSKKCVHSDVGSANACQAAMLAFEALLLKSNGDSNTLAENFRAKFAREMLNKWQELCKSHFEYHHTLENKTEATADASFSEGGDFLNNYGTTLSAAFLSDKELFLFRIGDSDITVLDDNKNSPYFAFKDDDSLVGSQTHSLCTKNAFDNAQVDIISATDLKAVFLTTDGVINSFGTDEGFFRALSKSVYGQMGEFGLQAMIDSLPDYMRNMTKKGSGDDVTLVCVAFSYPKDADSRGDVQAEQRCNRDCSDEDVQEHDKTPVTTESGKNPEDRKNYHNDSL